MSEKIPDSNFVQQIEERRRNYVLTAQDMEELIEVIGFEENQGQDVTFTVQQLRAVIGDEEVDRRSGVTALIEKENARRQSVRVQPRGATGKFVTLPFLPPKAKR